MIAGSLELQLLADIARLRADMEKAKGVVEEAAKGMNAALENVKNTLIGLGGVWASLKSGELLKDAALLAARYETLGIVMKVTGNNAGYTAAEMNKTAEALRESGISMKESRDIMIQLVTAEIDVADATKLARTAQDLAVVGNVNSSEALQRMVYAIKSAQVEMLRTLGLNVTFEESYKRMAMQLGKTTETLTDHEKMQARVQVVLRESAKFAGIYEESMTTAGKAIGSLTRYWEDFKTLAGEVFLPALADAVFTLMEAFKILNGGLRENNDSVKTLGSYLNDVFKIVMQTVGVLVVNTAYVFKSMGREIGGVLAQLDAFASRDWKGFIAIRDAMKADAESDRQAVDAATAKMMGLGAPQAAAPGKSEADRMAEAKAAREVADAEKKRILQGAALLAFQKQYGNNQEKLNLQLKEWREKLGTAFTPEIEKKIRDEFVKKGRGEMREAEGLRNQSLENQAAMIKRSLEEEERMTKATVVEISHARAMGRINDVEQINQTADAELKSLQRVVDDAQSKLGLASRRTKDGKVDQKAVIAAESELDKARDAFAARQKQRFNDVEEAQYRRRLEMAKAEFEYREQMVSEQDAERARLGDVFKENVRAQQTERDDISEQLELRRAEIGLMGESDDQITIRIGKLKIQKDLEREIARIRGLGLDPADRQDLEDRAKTNAGQQEDLLKVNATLDEQKKIWSSIDDTAHSVFTNIFDSGSDAFKRLGQTLKASLLDLLYQMTIKKWIFNIVGNIAGVIGGGGVGGAVASGATQSAMGSLGSSVGMLGTVGSMFGAGGLGGSLAAGAGWLTGATSLGGAVGAGASLIGAGGAGITAGIGMLAGALGPIALGVYGLYKLFGQKGGGPKEEGAFGAGIDVGAHALPGHTSFDPLAKQTADTAQKLLNQYAQMMGGNASGISFGVGISTDPKGTAPSMVQFNALRNGGVLAGSINTNVGRSEDDLKNALSTQMGDVIIDALLNSGIDAEMAAYFRKISAGLEGDAKMQALEAAAAVGKLRNDLQQLGSVSANLTHVSVEAAASMVDLAGGIDNLSSGTKAYFDNFYNDQEKRNLQFSQISKVLQTQGGLPWATQEFLKNWKRDDFRKYVESLNLEDEAQRKAYVSLMSVAGAFAEVSDQTQTVITLTDAQGKLTTAYNDQKNSLEQTRQKALDFVQTFKDFRSSLLTDSSVSPLSAQDRYAQALSDYIVTKTAALAGDQNAQQKYQEVAKTFLDQSRNMYASSDQYRSDFERVMNDTTSMETMTQAQYDTATAQLQALDESVKTLININDSVLSVRDAINLLYRIKQGEVVVEGVPLASGMTRVPFDNFPARLHAGEAVLPPGEAANWRSGGELVREVRALREEVTYLRQENRQDAGNQIAAVLESSDAVAERQARSTAMAARRSASSKPVVLQ